LAEAFSKKIRANSGWSDFPDPTEQLSSKALLKCAALNLGAAWSPLPSYQPEALHLHHSSELMVFQATSKGREDDAQDPGSVLMKTPSFYYSFEKI
jgi:hypothetical protein